MELRRREEGRSPPEAAQAARSMRSARSAPAPRRARGGTSRGRRRGAPPGAPRFGTAQCRYRPPCPAARCAAGPPRAARTGCRGAGRGEGRSGRKRRRGCVSTAGWRGSWRAAAEQAKQAASRAPRAAHLPTAPTGFQRCVMTCRPTGREERWMGRWDGNEPQTAALEQQRRRRPRPPAAAQAVDTTGSSREGASAGTPVQRPPACWRQSSPRCAPP